MSMCYRQTSSRVLYTVLLYIVVLTGVQGATYSSRGTSFVFAFQDIYVPTSTTPSAPYNPGYGRVLVTSEVGATVVLSVPGANLSSTVVVGAQGSQLVDFNASSIRTSAGLVQDRSVRVIATAAISVYAVNQGDFSSDGTIIFPTSMLGSEYIIASFEGHYFGSLLTVVASSSSASVQLMKPDFVSGYVLNSSITLQPYETYMFSSLTDDFTGWKIISSSPVAVFGGHSCSQVPHVSPGLSSAVINLCIQTASQVWEMMLPTQFWGTEYVVPPTPGRTVAGNIQQYVRVIGQAPTYIELQASGVSLNISQQGEWVSFNSTLNQAELVRCSTPCMVVHYMTDFSYDAQNTDPAMTLLPPVDAWPGNQTLATLYHNSVAHLALSVSQQVWTNYAVVVTNDTSSVAVFASSIVSSSWVLIPGTNYSWSYYSNLTTTQPSSTLTVGCSACLVLVAGFSFSDSYAYIGGWQQDDGTVGGTTGGEDSGGLLIIIIGAAVGAFVVIAIVVGIVIYRLKKKKAAEKSAEEGKGKGLKKRGKRRVGVDERPKTTPANGKEKKKKKKKKKKTDE